MKSPKKYGSRTDSKNENSETDLENIYSGKRGTFEDSVMHTIETLNPPKSDIEEIINDTLLSKPNYENLRREIIDISMKYVKATVFSRTIEMTRILKSIPEIFEEIVKNQDILFILSCIKKLDIDTYKHSIHVATLSLTTGLLLGYDYQDALKIASGAILHDTGKLMIKKEILTKPSKLTNEEMDEMKKHTTYGYEILLHCANINLDCAKIALCHHERYDGSGYPMSLFSNEIDEWSKIVAIADVYDALTSDRVYRKGVHPNMVMEQIFNMCPDHFDESILKIFMKITSVYPNGVEVLLNNNLKAKIIRQNSILPSMPIVEILFLDYKEELDLYKNKDLYIIGPSEKH